MTSKNDRALGRKCLEQVINSEKNQNIFEKSIFELTTKLNEPYLSTIYQICGILLKLKEEIKEDEKKSKINTEVLKQIKEEKVNWNSPIYDSVRFRIEEHDQYLIHPFDVVEGVVKCVKCGESKTWSIQKQTRSADEPMTTFSKCVVCGAEWSYSG